MNFNQFFSDKFRLIISCCIESSIIWCFFSGGILISYLLFVSFFSLLCSLPTEVILSAILFPVESPVASAGFFPTLSDAVFAASILVFQHLFLFAASIIINFIRDTIEYINKDEDDYIIPEWLFDERKLIILRLPFSDSNEKF